MILYKVEKAMISCRVKVEMIIFMLVEEKDYIDGGDGIDTIDFSHINSKIDLTLKWEDTESKVKESNLETHTLL